MKERWQTLWNRLGFAGGEEPLFRDLVARYSENHRKYHTLQHLEECLNHFDEFREGAEHPLEIELALWFHDAVYEVKRKDNEKKSADWARSFALEMGLESAAAERIHALIMATLHDALPQGPDAQIMIDVDLAILGAEESRFEEYEQQVREEYGWVPGILFRRSRKKVLKGFLERPRIYSTARFTTAREEQARKNIRLSLRQLRG